MITIFLSVFFTFLDILVDPGQETIFLLTLMIRKDDYRGVEYPSPAPYPFHDPFLYRDPFVPCHDPCPCYHGLLDPCPDLGRGGTFYADE